jgi:predicted dehydrogenase
MKVAIISFAHMHAYSYADVLSHINDVNLVGIYDEDPARGDSAARRYKTVYYPNLDALLRIEGLETVIVCSENAKHRNHVVAAAQAHKHILCEKPIATTIEDAKEMIAVCEKYNVILQIAFPVRFSPPIQRVKQLIEQDKIGRILAMRGTNHGQNPGGWFVDRKLSGGGAILDHTVHIIDIMRWYTGSEITEVFAEVDTKFNQIPCDDCGLLMLEFENGIIASHDPSWSRPKSFPTWGDVTLKIVSTGGITEIDALAQHIDGYYDTTMKQNHLFWGDGYDFGLVTEFIHSVRKNQKPSITGYDGLQALKVALAAYESASTRKPVRIAE